MNASVLKLWFQINFVTSYHFKDNLVNLVIDFVYNLDLTLEALTHKNPFLTLIIGDFNAKFNKWCSTHKTTPEGAKLDSLTSQYSLTQILVHFGRHPLCMKTTTTK